MEGQDLFCENCGADIIAGQKFCSKCGLEQKDSIEVKSPLNEVVEENMAEKEIVSTHDDKDTEPLEPDIPTPVNKTKKADPKKFIFLFLGLLIIGLMAGGGFFYLNKISSPEQVLADFASNMKKGNYEAAYQRLVILERHQASQTETSKEDFRNWQNILDEKYGQIDKVEISKTSIYDRGYKSGQASGSTMIKIKRGQDTQQIHARLISSSKRFNLIPDWKIAFPTEIIAATYLGIPEGTKIYLNGGQIAIYDEYSDSLKIETFAGSHQILLKLDIAEPVEIFPQEGLDFVDLSYFELKREEKEKIMDLIETGIEGYIAAWNTLGRNTLGFEVVYSDPESNTYVNHIKDNINYFLEYLEYTHLDLVSLDMDLEEFSIRDIGIETDNAVLVSALETIIITAKYRDNYYLYDDYIYEEVFEDAPSADVFYRLIKEGGEWRIDSKFY